MDGYVRVSRVGGRTGPGYISPTVQREAIERWASYRNVRIDQWHVDEDESGGTQDRPGLVAAVDRAVSGQTGGIVAWKIDRFSRFTEGGLRDLRRLEQAGARLVFVTEDIDTSGPIGKFVYTILLAMSEYVLDNIKAGWTVAKTKAISRGAHIGPTPYGYVRAADGTLEVDPERGPIVTEAFQVAAAGGLHAVTTFLLERAPERTWTGFTVERFLSNRTYLGRVGSGEHVNPDAHQPLVSRREFEAANNLPPTRLKRRPSGDFPLSGIAVCAWCSGKLVGARGGNDKRRMYRCARRCEQPAVVTADLLEGHVVASIAEILQGVRFTLGDPGPDASGAVAALEDAERDLDDFAGDTTARRLLGDRWHTALENYVKAVEEAQENLRTELAKSGRLRNVTGDELEPADLAETLRGTPITVTVRRGRLPIAERVRFVIDDLDGDTMPAGQDPGV